MSIIIQLFLLLINLDIYLEKYPKLKKKRKLLIITPKPKETVLEGPIGLLQIGDELIENRMKMLIENGFNIVIYANHLFRAAYPAMFKTAHSILKHGRSKEIDNSLIGIKEILELVPGTK